MDIRGISSIYRIGHELGEIRANIRQDFALDVGGINLEGRDGDTLNLPRWLCQILEKEDLISTEHEDMMAELQQAFSKEDMADQYELPKLESNFYIKLKMAMDSLKGRDLEKAEDLLIQLFRIRRGKIVVIADSVDPAPDARSHMTVEERVFYEEIHNISRQFESQMEVSKSE